MNGDVEQGLVEHGAVDAVAVEGAFGGYVQMELRFFASPL